MGKNLTSLVSCFARGYHYLNNDSWVFEDALAHCLLTKQEYQEISQSMIEGIHFFFLLFEGTKEEALKWIVNHQLAPTVLARSAFYQDCLKQKMERERQYLIFGSGLDSFAYSLLKGLNVFEIDRPDVIKDKLQRLKNAHIDYDHVHFIGCQLEDDDWISQLYKNHYCQDVISFSSLLGLCYYLSKDDFSKLLCILNKNVKEGSYLVFDYPCDHQSRESLKNKQLASGAGDSMKAKYQHDEIEKLLLSHGFEIEKHLDYDVITHLYFDEYNQCHYDSPIIPFQDISYVFARKR